MPCDSRLSDAEQAITAAFSEQEPPEFQLLEKLTEVVMQYRIIYAAYGTNKSISMSWTVS